jgi:hypothetical protein
MLDAMTQGRSHRGALRMMADLVQTMADKPSFHVAVFPGARGAFEIGSTMWLPWLRSCSAGSGRNMVCHFPR